MELAVAIMIVAVFGVWIYGLKQEISTLQKRLPRETVPGPEEAGVRPATVRMGSPNEVRPVRSQDGVQTWVLE